MDKYNSYNDNYNDSFFNGGVEDHETPLINFAKSHIEITFVLAIIGLIALLIMVIWLVSTLYSKMFSSDSFVGSYMHWRPNVQDRSELNAIMDANRVEPPIQFPMDLLKNDADVGLVDTNLGGLY